ncbi:hypothetical protein BSKO_11387 [Bryopsis sp. KO-2023]|nr:hypothetical protein BSKO_11387 [Bryopsis sp. KO-2023]
MTVYKGASSNTDPFVEARNVADVEKWHSTVLNLSGMELTRCPKGIRACKSLSEVILTNNSIASLPERVFPRSLQTLRITGNALTALPSDLSRLNSLKNLHAGANRLESIDASLDCLSLQHAGFGYNQLSAFPKRRHEKICSLDVSHNHLCDLEELLKTLATWDSLSCLSLRGNPFCFKRNYVQTIRSYLPQLLFLDGKRLEEIRNRSAMSIHGEEGERLEEETYLSIELTKLKLQGVDQPATETLADNLTVERYYVQFNDHAGHPVCSLPFPQPRENVEEPPQATKKSKEKPSGDKTKGKAKGTGKEEEESEQVHELEWGSAKLKSRLAISKETGCWMRCGVDLKLVKATVKFASTSGDDPENQTRSISDVHECVVGESCIRLHGLLEGYDRSMDQEVAFVSPQVLWDDQGKPIPIDDPSQPHETVANAAFVATLSTIEKTEERPPQADS